MGIILSIIGQSLMVGLSCELNSPVYMHTCMSGTDPVVDEVASHPP